SGGAYNFTLLRPGTYVVTEVTQPAGFVDGRDQVGSLFGGTAAAPPGDAISNIVIPAHSNAAATNYNFGELLPATIGNFVWEALNGNGVQDAGEPGLVGVPVTLNGIDDALNPVTASTTSGALGAYQFTNLRPGAYTVTFGAFGSYVRTLQNSPVAT